jgi:hypothetical protein
MSNVIRFPGHKLRQSTSFVRDDGVHIGVDWCKCCETCGGGEESLPTHCPGARMDQTMESAVQMGIADFKDGEWWFYEYRAREVFDG